MIVELKPEEWNVIINTMAQAPYSQVANIITSMVSQLQNQQNAAQAAAKEQANLAGNGASKEG